MTTQWWTEYYLRPPRGKRGGYSIIKRRRVEGQPTKNETVDSPALDAINTQLRAGQMPADEAREAAKRELSRLRKLAGGGKVTTLRQSNLRLLDKYWDAVYADRDIVAPKAARERLRRAVESLGDVPLTADIRELQAALNRSCAGNKQRDRASALNQILKWMGRPDARLRRARKERRSVRFLTWPEVTQMAAQLRDPDIRNLAVAAFVTGCRTGELFYIQKQHLREGVLLVEQQMYEGMRPGDTKNRRVRDVVVIPEGAAQLDKWIATSEARRAELRSRRYSTLIRNACRRAFPDAKSKWLTFHDLRHSYAIYLINKGVSLALVAQSLGDSEAVANEYYSGFVLTKPGIEAIRAALTTRPK